MTAPAIVVCEPQCAGFEHAPHNAALLATAALAFPNHPLHFLAESSHQEAVRRLLAASPAHAGIDLKEFPIAVPDRRANAARVLRAEFAVHADALRHAKSVDAGLVLFASVSEPALLALHALLRMSSKRPPVLVIAHGMLANLGHPQPSLSKRLLGVHRTLRAGMPPGVQWIALGAPILEQLEDIAPKAARHFRTMDHPYLWHAQESKPAGSAATPCFGYLGVANRHKGFERFVRVARAVRERGIKARFLLAGFVPEGTPLDDAADIVEGLGHAPLTREAYAARLAEIDFVLWTGDPDHYRLTASGSFLDALSFVKPGVYLSNPYIAHYAGRMGDIGDLCANEEALIEAVCAAKVDDRHAAQCRMIQDGRRLFEPETLAPQLRAIASECGFD